MKNEVRKYEGFSLIETLFTIVILSIVMLLVATTLNTVIKTSHTANSKNLARRDINYIMETYERLLSNARLDDIYLFDSSGIRSFGYNGNHMPIISTSVGAPLATVYDDQVELSDGVQGNEIHVRLYGYSTWTCLGYFKDARGNGYIVKTTSDGLSEHSSCFSDTAIISLLHSFSIDATDFFVSYIDIGDGENRMFVINATLTPLYWPVSNSFKIEPSVSRQLVVSTRALTRY